MTGPLQRLHDYLQKSRPPPGAVEKVPPPGRARPCSAAHVLPAGTGSVLANRCEDVHGRGRWDAPREPPASAPAPVGPLLALSSVRFSPTRGVTPSPRR